MNDAPQVTVRRIKALVRSDTGGYEITDQVEAFTLEDAIREFVSRYKSMLINGNTSFEIDGGRRYSYRWK